MDREPVSSPARGRRKRQRRGLHLTERDGTWHIVGTIRVDRQSIRIRRSTGIAIAGAAEEDAAERIRLQVEQDVRQEVITGKPATGSFAEAARDFLKTDKDGHPRQRPLGEHTKDVVKELLLEFSVSPIAKIDKARIDAYYRARSAPHPIGMKRKDGTFRIVAPGPATIRRHQAVLRAILVRKVDVLPKHERPAKLKRKGRGVGKKLPAILVQILVDRCAHPAHRAPWAVMFATGARVGMTMATKRTGSYVLAPGRERVMFDAVTKNGNIYDRRLHPWAAAHVRAYFLSRRDKHADAFLTPAGRPYKRIHGGMFKTAWRASIRRLTEALTTMTSEEWIAIGGDAHEQPVDWIPLVKQVTPHWARHTFGNTLKELGVERDTIRDSGMWESDEAVDENYLVGANVRMAHAVLSLPFGGTDLTRIVTPPLKGVKKSRD